MFTFDDLAKLDAASAQTLLRNVEKDKLAVALKGSNEAVREFFFGNMTARAAKMLRDDMEALGPVRLRDVDEVQSEMVNVAKDLAARGEIMITRTRATTNSSTSGVMMAHPARFLFEPRFRGSRSAGACGEGGGLCRADDPEVGA